MNRTTLSAVLLAALTAMSTVAMVQHGYLAIFEAAFTSSSAMQLGLDLVCALSLVGLWMVEDAREKGLSVWPWLVAIPFLGSLAPLAYVVYAHFAAPHGASARTSSSPA
ncbi:MAG: DUF2834 domain-containing protein [Deltaproteobacteria bacterium]|nr:MAG: DUF2834 domain-containing protein [Deltaproteobacteria bacterium]